MSNHDRTRAQVGAALLESTSDAIILTDVEGIIRLWNPGAERIFGHSREAALGCSLDLIIPQRLRARHWSGYHEVMRTQRSRYGAGDTLAVPALRSDGVEISVEFSLTFCHDAEQTLDGMVAVIRDVTERFQEIRALRKALAARDET
ncbi:MAG: PAS domain S-box protein [Gammaproteobacteria bacterium]|nr:PAS domain S-box protein [Gammaproteobacteria bacterium]